jgi:hypothetical protein
MTRWLLGTKDASLPCGGSRRTRIGSRMSRADVAPTSRTKKTKKPGAGGTGECSKLRRVRKILQGRERVVRLWLLPLVRHVCDFFQQPVVILVDRSCCWQDDETSRTDAIIEVGVVPSFWDVRMNSVSCFASRRQFATTRSVWMGRSPLRHTMMSGCFWSYAMPCACLYDSEQWTPYSWRRSS